jgi:hypothetical protein
LGMSFLSFDWAITSFIGSPLVTPVGFIPFFCHTHCSHRVIPSGGAK